MFLNKFLLDKRDGNKIQVKIFLFEKFSLKVALHICYQAWCESAIKREKEGERDRRKKLNKLFTSYKCWSVQRKAVTSVLK